MKELILITGKNEVELVMVWSISPSLYSEKLHVFRLLNLQVYICVHVSMYWICAYAHKHTHTHIPYVDQKSKLFSVKDQTVNILGTVHHIWSLSHIHLNFFSYYFDFLQRFKNVKTHSWLIGLRKTGQQTGYGLWVSLPISDLDLWK